jgi:hypothetical protein
VEPSCEFAHAHRSKVCAHLCESEKHWSVSKLWVQQTNEILNDSRVFQFARRKKTMSVCAPMCVRVVESVRLRVGCRPAKRKSQHSVHLHNSRNHVIRVQQSITPLRGHHHHQHHHKHPHNCHHNHRQHHRPKGIDLRAATHQRLTNEILASPKIELHNSTRIARGCPQTRRTLRRN